ncbi:MAG: hypothetical protein AAFZ52_06315 [Bacteroidota bacterium]
MQALLYHLFSLFSFGATPTFVSAPEVHLMSDSIPLPIAKTWQDSGYYFQLNTVDWIARRVDPDETRALVTFRSADAGGSTAFSGRGVLRPGAAAGAGNAFPDLKAGDRGSAILALPQDLVLCPSAEMSLGLGASEIDLPLFVDGRLSVFNDTILFQNPQIRLQVMHFEMR